MAIQIVQMQGAEILQRLAIVGGAHADASQDCGYGALDLLVLEDVADGDQVIGEGEGVQPFHHLVQAVEKQ